MTFLTKPYTPVAFTSATKSFNVYGKSLYQITNVYLSGIPYTNQTFYNPFSAVPKLSANYPGFFGIKLLSSEYQSNNDNTITFTMPSASEIGYVDIIVQNPAGYGKLTQYVVKNLYDNTQTQLELRPWSNGIKVLNLQFPGDYIAFWKFSDLTDSSTNGNNLSSGGGVQFVPGKIGNCAQFDGTFSTQNQLTLSSFTPSFSASQDFSISFWVKPSTTLLPQPIIGGSNFQIDIFRLGLRFYGGSQRLILVNTAADANNPRWAHFVCIKAAGRIKIYMNGNLVYNELPIEPFVGITTDVGIGWTWIGGSSALNGYIDAMGIWQRELTQSEVNVLYNYGDGREI